MPYNFAFPETKLNGYTMEVTTLNSYFVDKAHAQHQLVYSWDVNDQATLNKMQLYGVDGIITDRFSDMKANLAEQKDQPHYAALINSFTDIAGSVWAE
jgi:Glycerophosphoryl diester phosphodiesterase